MKEHSNMFILQQKIQKIALNKPNPVLKNIKSEIKENYCFQMMIQQDKIQINFLMPNMFNVLYTKYIDQIKLEEIQNYNKKHQQYLLKHNNSHWEIQSQSLKDKNFNSKSNVQLAKIAQSKNLPKEPSVNENRQQLKVQPQKQRPIRTKPQEKSFASEPYSKNKPLQKQTKAIKQNLEQVEQKRLATQAQRAIKPSQAINFSNQQIINQEQQNIILEECPEGCGRKFKSIALEKHIRICQKVFQEKRRPFKVDVVDNQAKIHSQKNIVASQKSEKQKSGKVSKWKKQSEHLRKGLKALQRDNTKQQQKEQEQQDDRVLCEGCGRRFNETAAQKHIPKCIIRNKNKK